MPNEIKEENYKGYKVVAQKDGNRIEGISWSICKKGKSLFDFRTIDGDKLQSVSHAMNDAKKNIDTFYRLANDKKKYNKRIKRSLLLLI